MLDPLRWVLLETWLSLGLSWRWADPWERRDFVDKEDWQEPTHKGSPKYCYLGLGKWISKPYYEHAARVEPTSAPIIETEDLLHELAHWIVATEEQRCEKNFGMSPGISSEGDDIERRVTDTEKVIRTLALSCGRIATMALQGGQ